jgi:hypothetical protein
MVLVICVTFMLRKYICNLWVTQNYFFYPVSKPLFVPDGSDLAQKLTKAQTVHRVPKTCLEKLTFLQKLRQIFLREALVPEWHTS